MSSATKALLAAVGETGGGPQAFLDLVKKHNARDENYNFGEIFELLSAKEQEQLWTHVCEKLHAKFAAAFSEGTEEEDDDGEDGLVDYVEAICTIGLAALSTSSPLWSDSFFATVTLLHDALLLLSDEHEGLQDAICRMCELCIKLELPRCEALLPNTISLLLLRSLAPRSPGSLVKRIHGLKQVLHVLDLDASHDLRSYLLQTVAHPTYVKVAEGRRFIAFLFGLSLPFVDQLYTAIKQALPPATSATCAAYGEVIFRAWRDAPATFTSRLETNVIQDLMYHAVHAAKPPSGAGGIGGAVRKVLSHIHQQKKHRGVDAMLSRLYEPILWRALNVANPLVRANAAALLFDAFPLIDPGASRADADSAIQQQFDCAADLLLDDDPAVRSIAVLGVTRILNTYWEMVPMATTTTLLEIIANDLAWDVQAAPVRVAVCEGLESLLDNALAGPVLAALLPHLAPLLHDTSERVRCAFADLLLRVKDVRAIKFWKIVPLPELVARLDVDTAAVGRRLTALLLRSFVPHDQPVATLVDRCEALATMNPRAARRFYMHARAHVPVEGLAALAKALLDRQTSTPLSDIETTLLDVAAICLDIPGAQSQARIQAAAAETLPRLLANAAGDELAIQAVLRMASSLRGAALDRLAADWLEGLAGPRDEPLTAVEVGKIDCLARWGYGKGLVQLITSRPSAGTGKKRARTMHSSLPGVRAIAVAHVILDHPRRREAVLQETGLEELAMAVQVTPDVLHDALANNNGMAEKRLVLYGRVAVARLLHNGDPTDLERLATLANDILAPAVKENVANEMATKCLDSAFDALAEPLSVGVVDDTCINALGRICRESVHISKAMARACYLLYTHGHGEGLPAKLLTVALEANTTDQAAWVVREYGVALVRHAQQHGDADAVIAALNDAIHPDHPAHHDLVPYIPRPILA